MKAGDKFPVTIAGETITEATVKEVDESKNTATMMVPATLVTMSYRTHDELTPNEPVAPEAVEGADHILLTDRVEQQAPGPVTPGEAAQRQTLDPTPVEPAKQPDTTPTPAQEPVVPVVPEKVEEAVEREATQ